MKTIWKKRMERDQNVLWVGLVCIIFLILYFLILTPLSKNIQSLTEEVNQQKDLWVWMQKTIPLLETYRDLQPIENSDLPLLTLIDDSIMAANLNAYQPVLQQVGANTANISFQKVSYGRLTMWLTKIWHLHHIEVKTLSLVNIHDPGLVQAQVTLQKKIDPI